MDDEKFEDIFVKFVEDSAFSLPVMQQDGENYSSKLETIYSKYLDLLNNLGGSEDYKEIKESAEVLCRKIVEIINSKPEDRSAIMDQILQSYLDEASSHHLLIYGKKSIDGLLDDSVFHSEDEERDLLYLYRATNRVDIVNDESSQEGKLRQMFHCPYDLLDKISSTRYSMKGVPSLYMATSITLSLSELRSLNKNGEAYISKLRINREPSESVKQINILEFGIIPSDFNENHTSYEGDKDLAINDYRVFQIGLLKKIKVKKSYLFWYPLIVACSFIRKNDTGESKIKEYPEYIIPQLFLTQLNIKSASSNLVYGIRYFSCAETIETIKKSELNFSEKLVDNFKMTIPLKYPDSNRERELNNNLKQDGGAPVEPNDPTIKTSYWIGNVEEGCVLQDLPT